MPFLKQRHALFERFISDSGLDCDTFHQILSVDPNEEYKIRLVSEYIRKTER
ncbi:hypothetical protein FH581_006795 [Leptospira weilii]|nr:hypothetical protein FH581_006795 [Leptospira weilii]